MVEDLIETLDQREEQSNFVHVLLSNIYDRNFNLTEKLFEKVRVIDLENS
jgi:hypothetical protein